MDLADSWTTGELSWGGGASAALGVGDLTRHVAALLREDVILQDVWVRGEISNLVRAASGHVYFSLKDADACLGCVMWRSSAGRLRFRPENGTQVVAHGAVDLYAPRGQYQLVVDDLEPDGLGSIYLALEQAKARLLAEGLLDRDRKRPLPAFPRTVAVVTSLQGAAVRDVCAILHSSSCPPQVVLVPALVQGPGSVESLCAAMRRAEQLPGVELLVIARGGGSVEDLWSFNSEALARVIASCRVPVISAVGHESDVTLADLAADFRAPTPTAAAEEICELREDMVRRWAQATRDVQALFAGRVEAARLRWEGLSRRMPLSRPEWPVETRRQRLDDLRGRLLRAMESRLVASRHRLALTAGQLHAVSPLATLARGYAAVTRLEDGAPVRGVGGTGTGERLRVRFRDGSLVARVEWVDADPIGMAEPGSEEAGSEESGG